MSWQSRAAEMPGILGDFGSMIWGGDDSMDDYRDMMNQGQNQIDQYTQQAIGYMQPYMDAGQRGIAGEEGMIGKFADPYGNYDEAMSHWSMSPGNRARMTSGMAAIRNAMAARGLGGSGNEVKGLADYTQNLINQDQQQYLQNIFGQQRTALSGYGDMANRGYGAAGMAGRFASSAGQDIASMTSAMAQAQAEQDQSDDDNFWGSLGGLASGIGSLIKNW